MKRCINTTLSITNALAAPVSEKEVALLKKVLSDSDFASTQAGARLFLESDQALNTLTTAERTYWSNVALSL